MKLTLDEMLAHIEQLDGRVYKNVEVDHWGSSRGPSEFSIVSHKVDNLIKKFGFYVVGLSGHYITYQLDLGDYNYIRIRKGYTKVPGRKPGTMTFTASLKVTRNRKAINPHTGRPWEIGDIDYSSPLQPMLTKDGWWTGD